MESIERIRENFSFFDDWEDKYRFVIDLGKEIPELEEKYKTTDYLVPGCQSQVWLVTDFSSDDPHQRLRIDSDAHIVRGLIAIVLAAYATKSVEEIKEYAIEKLFEELHLLSHLSQTRGNGLKAMVARIQQAAHQHLWQPVEPHAQGRACGAH